MDSATDAPPLSVGILPLPSNTANDDASLSSNSSSSSFCPHFPNDAALDAWLQSIAPPRELVCPITQELLKDPVVAQDGHTYERASLLRWFGMGRNRSPVTNSLLSNTSVEGLVPNLAVQGMASAHRERLGKKLVKICQGVKERGGRCEDGGVRIEGLLDAGADPNGRSAGGNTPLHLLIQSGNIALASHLLNHDANVTLANDDGMDCIATAYAISKCYSSQTVEWNDFIEELKRRESLEKARAEARERARNRANEEHRERQRTLAASSLSSANGSDNNGTNQRGLGRLEDGVGYFPSLAALQFQSAIPGPSPSVAHYENKEKERLDRILKGLAVIVVAYLLMS